MTAISLQRQPTDLTVTDVFCGAGGNTIGAKAAGMRVLVGLNHWDRAIETYGTNNPEVKQIERVDVSLCDPRRYHSTDIGIFSPECTTHSPAGGNKHARPTAQRDLFAPKLDPATVRSRVTMFDVVRFTEYHRYRIVIVENVVEATRWELWADWLRMMDRLGYDHRVLCLNSMFFHPTPQSRDRLYVVFWRRGNRAPDLDYQPPAPCATCGVICAVQVWKRPERPKIGKYRRQYVYACPRCAKEVTPFYYAALNALDLSLAADRIGDREKPLRPRTMERIAYGLEKFGRQTLVVNVKQGERDSSRAWPAAERELGSIPTWDNYFGVAQPAPFLVSDQMARRVYDATEPLATQTASRPHDAVVQPAPFLVACANDGGVSFRTLGVDEPLRTVHAGGGNHALVQPGFLVETAHTNDGERRARGLGDALPTMSGQQTSALVTPFLVTQRANAQPASLDTPLATVAANGNHHMLVTGAAQLSMRDYDAMRVAGLDAELMTQGCGPQQALISRAPFIVSQYNTLNVRDSGQPLPAVTTVERQELVQPGPALTVDDCYFRMLQPHEIGRGMAFPDAYVVGGNKRDRVKQYGNAVTPPVMDWIVRAAAASLHPELSDG